MWAIKAFRFIIPFIFAVILEMGVYSQNAEDITKAVELITENISVGSITDNNIATHSAGENVSISVKSHVPVGGIYIKHGNLPSPGLLDDTVAVSENGFLHEYIELNGKTEFVLTYEKADICDIFIFSQGVIPDWVQCWEIGENETDLLLLPTHSDDDQLFFAGILPYYAVYKNARVRVAYFVNHYDTYNRTHELLDGLWHCGVKYYPYINEFPDLYSNSFDDAVNGLKARGYTYEDVLNFQRYLLNTYRPLVVVTHDFNGEYGHGAHILNAKSLVEVCENPLENQYVPQKIYVHLYNDRQITVDVDTGLDCFDGKSPFNISQEAFGFHKSQHWTWFYKWIYGTGGSISSASQIRSYNPAKYGLYYTSVGDDSGTMDMLENVITYDELDRIRRDEEHKRLEAEKENQQEINQYKNNLQQADTDIEAPSQMIQNNTNKAWDVNLIAILAVVALLICVVVIIINRRNC